MSTELVPFAYEGADVRVIVIDGEPWFVLADLCRVLGIANAGNVAARLSESDVRQTDISSGGQRRSVTIVNESGMYEVVIRSDKPEAVAFRRWLTGEVLPAIRKTGGFGRVAPKGEELLALAVLEARTMLAAKDERIAELEPKAEAFDELMDANGCYSMNAAAKILGWGRNVMMRELRRLGVLQGNNLPYQRYEHHFKLVPNTYYNPKIEQTVPTVTTFVRPSGVEYLRKRLATVTV